jgi:histidine ammonia-lyase
MSLILGGGKRLSVDEVVSSSVSKPNLISVEESALEKLDLLCKDISEKNLLSFHEVHNSSKMKPNDFSVEIRRAGLILRIHSLLNGKSPVRSSTVKVMLDLLNHQITPYFSSFEKAGAEFVEFLGGKGYASTADREMVSASDALQLIGCSAYLLTNFETSAFIKHPFALIGLATIVVGGANFLLKAADSIAAFSCEAKGVLLDPFDFQAFELYRQHRGQITSANNVRLLLEGSKRLIANSADCNSSFSAFNNIPQIHGPNFDIVAQAIK